MRQPRPLRLPSRLGPAVVSAGARLFGFPLLLGLLLLAGCRTGRPAIEHWEGCLAEDAALEVADQTKVPNPASPPPKWVIVEQPGNAVLSMQTDWGESSLATEHHHAELRLQLPGPITEGYRWNLGPTHPVDARITGELATKFEYREGADVLMFGSEKVTGSIIVTAANDTSVTAMLDLTASDPYVDPMKRNSVVIRGTVTALRVRNPSDCPR